MGPALKSGCSRVGLVGQIWEKATREASPIATWANSHPDSVARRASRAANERVDFFPVQWESHDEIVWVRMIDT